jgi:uncharacterized phiE125 gp8 family phage protein
MSIPLNVSPSVVTILTPAASRLLAQPAEVVAELGLAAGDETLVATLVARASADIEDRCGRPLVREGVRETWRIFHDERVSLARAPLVSIDSVVEAGRTLVEADYELGTADPRVARLWRLDGAYRRRWCGSPALVIEYIAGYIPAGEAGCDVPAKLNEACVALVRQRWQARDRDRSVRQELVEGLGRIVYEDTNPGGDGRFSPEIEELIFPYVRLGVG